MKKYFIAAILLHATILSADDSIVPASMFIHRDNYFIFGDMDDQVKFQFSAKYQLVNPAGQDLSFDYEKNSWYSVWFNYLKVFGSWSYLAYTQTSWWTVYEDRDSFSSNYQPELFFMFESKKSIPGWDLGLVDIIRLSPYYHCSNGTEGPDHRSIHSYYGEIQLSWGSRYNFGTNIKMFGYYFRDAANRDINDYRHNYEADCFMKFTFDPDWWWPVYKEDIHFRFTGNPFDKGYFIIESITQFFASAFQPRIFIQYNNGYGVNILQYNKKATEFRAGLSFSH